jgi:hypothetical protein
MYHWRFWFVLGMAYFVIHFAVGVYNCQKYMCPGDIEGDWILEFTDEDTGKRMMMIDGKKILKEEYQKQMGIGPYNTDK